MKSFLKYWLPVLSWLGLIFIGSTDLMSAEHTSRFLVPFLYWLKPSITADAIAQIHFLIRKCSHLIEYAILAILLWRALYRGTNLKIKTSIVYVSVLIAAILFAAADEFHQSFVASRTALRGDVVVDVLGAMIGLAIYLALSRTRTKRIESGDQEAIKIWLKLI
jgi:VanZ family protein